MSPTSLLIFTQLFSFLPAAKPAPPFPSTTNTLPSRDELSLLHEKAEELVKLYLDFISYEQKLDDFLAHFEDKFRLYESVARDLPKVLSSCAGILERIFQLKDNLKNGGPLHLSKLELNKIEKDRTKIRVMGTQLNQKMFTSSPEWWARELEDSNKLQEFADISEKIKDYSNMTTNSYAALRDYINFLDEPEGKNAHRNGTLENIYNISSLEEVTKMFGHAANLASAYEHLAQNPVNQDPIQDGALYQNETFFKTRGELKFLVETSIPTLIQENIQELLKFQPVMNSLMTRCNDKMEKLDDLIRKLDKTRGKNMRWGWLYNTCDQAAVGFLLFNGWNGIFKLVFFTLRDQRVL